MKQIVKKWSLLAAAAVMATGCAPVNHNLPPEQRMLEPGPGVGGPGPGVLGSPSMMGGMRPPSGGPGMAIGPANSPMMSAPLMGGGMGGPGMMGQPGMMGPGMMSQPGVVNGQPVMGAPGMSGPMYQPASGSQAMVDGDADIAQVSHTCSCGGGCSLGGGCLARFRNRGGSNIPADGGMMMGGMGAPMMAGPPSTVQVTFGNPDGMQLKYDATGSGMFDSEPLVVPARQNFPQGGLYRVKLTNIPTRPGVELYPTVELAHANPRTGAYLAHNSVPIQFTEEDFDQVLTGNFVTKVIYLPDSDFQGPALAGIDTLVSTRLDPGIDPIVEADRRGSILAIIRLGDKDVEMGGSGNGYASGGYMAPPIVGLPAPFAAAMTDGCGGGPDGSCNQAPPTLPGMIAGVNAPQYGMPITGTPIGLPGPPHIPLGSPAGLKKHTIRNRTSMHIPRPVEHVKMNVRLQPGYSSPNPVSRVRITEQNINPGVPAGRGLYQKASQRVDPNCQP